MRQAAIDGNALGRFFIEGKTLYRLEAFCSRAVCQTRRTIIIEENRLVLSYLFLED
jgi:hypothetical protein